jgi:hypothetical protein
MNPDFGSDVSAKTAWGMARPLHSYRLCLILPVIIPSVFSNEVGPRLNGVPKEYEVQ